MDTTARDNRTRSEKAAALRVVFLPQWYGNPYQRLLDENLRALGVHVGRFRQTVGSIFVGLLRTRPHILHLHWLHAFHETPRKKHSWLRLGFSLSAVTLLRLLGCRIVWTAHNLGHHEATNQAIDRFCTRWIARRAHAIIVHGESARERLAARFALHKGGHLAVIPHGHYIGCYPNELSRSAARERLSLPEDGLVFLFFGQIRPYKGVLELVRAFRRLGRADLFLLVAGKPLTGESEEVIREAVSGEPNIRFTPGYVPDEAIQLYMNASDAVVLPYRDNLTSGAALLAMSFGRACLAPRVGHFAELLDEKGAFLYDPDGPDALLECMRTVAARRDELAEMGTHNLQLAEAYDWSRIAEKTLAVYTRARRGG